MGRIRDYLVGADLMSRNGHEDRTITRGTEREALTFAPRTALPPVSESQALKVADVFSAIKVLSDSLSSLPVHVYRETPRGREPAGDDQRLVQLLRRPAPGQTSADLVSQIVVDLAVNGNCFLAKFRRDGEIVQLGTLPPDQVAVERRGERIVYTLMRNGRRSEHGPEDIVHVRGMSRDGLRGLSPVRQHAKAIANAALDSTARYGAATALAHPRKETPCRASVSLFLPD